ncbi:hypothetical protein WJX79_006509 [Trebouxia sp. C0005]
MNHEAQATSVPVTDRMYSRDNGEGLGATSSGKTGCAEGPRQESATGAAVAGKHKSRPDTAKQCPSRLCSRTQPTPLSTHKLKASSKLVSSWRQRLMQLTARRKNPSRATTKETAGT